jgi:four helix bundle protein
MAHFKDLIVWQKSVDLTESVYRLTETFPNHQKFSLVDQMQRASVSIMSNIAEGSKRTPKEWANFLRIAFGSSAELESQFILAKRLNYISESQYKEFEDRLYHVTRMLNRMLYPKS